MDVELTSVEALAAGRAAYAAGNRNGAVWERLPPSAQVHWINVARAAWRVVAAMKTRDARASGARLKAGG